MTPTQVDAQIGSITDQLITKYQAEKAQNPVIDRLINNAFGLIRADLKKKGEVIEDLDLILAATCLVYNLTLITLNQKHFSHIPGLQIYSED